MKFVSLQSPTLDSAWVHTKFNANTGTIMAFNTPPPASKTKGGF